MFHIRRRIQTALPGTGAELPEVSITCAACARRSPWAPARTARAYDLLAAGVAHGRNCRRPLPSPDELAAARDAHRGAS